MEDVAAVIRTLNELERDGAIERYAIGGAVAAAFYLEPAETMDLGVFVPISAPAGSLIITLDPVLEYLAARGFELKGEYVIIGGWPVQFLPASPGLLEEALSAAALHAREHGGEVFLLRLGRVVCGPAHRHRRFSRLRFVEGDRRQHLHRPVAGERP